MPVTKDNLTKEIERIQSLISGKIGEAMSDPKFYEKFQQRIAREEEARNQALAIERITQARGEMGRLSQALMEEVVARSPAPDIQNSIDSIAAQFRARSAQRASVNLGRIFDIHDVSNRFINAVSDTLNSTAEAVTKKIEDEVEKLQKQFEAKVQQQIESYVENKLKKKMEEEEAKLKKLIEDPINQATESILARTRKADQAETAVITSMYKVSNFLKTGEFEVSFWQKMNIFSEKFKDHITNPQIFKPNPTGLTQLTQSIKKALESKSPDAIPGLIETFFVNEQKRIQSALTEMEQAIQEVEKKDGEEFAKKLLAGAEKEIEKRVPMYSAAKKIQTAASFVERAQAVTSMAKINLGGDTRSTSQKPSDDRKKRPTQ